MPVDCISILDGSTFLVSDRRGDIAASPEEVQGFFFRDTRFLSRWVLTLAGQRLDVLSTDDVDYFRAQFFLVPPTGTVYENPYLSIMRHRSIGDGFHEDIAVINHESKPVEIELRLEAAADFADLFEVKDALAKKGSFSKRVEGDVLVLRYEREDFVRETRIESSKKAELDEAGFMWRLTLQPQEEWSTCMFVAPVTEHVVEIKYDHDETEAKPAIGISLNDFIARSPKLRSDWDPLEHIYHRSLVDLAALRFETNLFPGRPMPAAGLPWFMTVFGRDSIITSYQALPFTSELSETTLRVLAEYQAKEVDDFRDAEPGRILHEIRFGEMVHFNERPHSPYYGTADATPLFLVVLDEYERWTGNEELVRELEPAARAALAWIDEYGDRDGDGYVEYQRRNEETGLENQCWKDSWDSIRFADGTIATGPIATCEIQGYVYDAKVRCARLARAIWADEELAERLEREAAELKAQFDRDFWVPARAHYAIALDGAKRRVDSLTSNVGHLLWSGIVPEDKAEAVARTLVGPRLFSGWGIRTMADGDGGYNPIRYHNGTVWPHDNSLAALGLTRYGFRAEAATVAFSVLEAATYFEYRLPEVFAGYARSRTSFPVEYPTSCSPQAWATGTPLALLRALLALEPDGDRLTSDPYLPDGIGSIELTEIPGRWGLADATTLESVR
jgi:glycogen debranching enzyme